MKYLSLFSGIGGFEVAIHRIFPDAECIGYSEVKPHAIDVYKHHFPEHKNLGDITKISNKMIKKVTKNGCDLVVGGFPCTNLSSMANIRGDSRGLKGKKSGLFYEMLRVISFANPRYILIENNYSMKKINRKIITEELQSLFEEKIYMTMINSADFGVQNRRRLYWTNFLSDVLPRECFQTWKDILVPVSKVRPSSEKMVIGFNRPIYKNRGKTETRIAVKIKENRYKFVQEKASKSRWHIGYISDNMSTELYPYPVGKSRPIIGTAGTNNVLIDRRCRTPGTFLLRKFTAIEKERLCGFKDGYTFGSFTKRSDLLGNTVVVHVIEYILTHIMDITQKSP